MLYSILIYNSPDILAGLSREEDDALVAQHFPLHKELAGEGKLGPVVRLMPGSAAMTLRKGAEPVVVDGPFAETKEQLLGLYIVDCATREEAVEAARRIPASCWHALEIRPVSWFHPGASEHPAGFVGRT